MKVPSLPPIALICLAASFFLCSCTTKRQVEVAMPTSREHVPEHSPNVFLVMYDAEVGKEPLLKAIKQHHVEIGYDYHLIKGMALKKPEDKSLEETMQLFRSVKGVTHVEYDHVYRLTDPVRPRLEIK